MEGRRNHAARLLLYLLHMSHCRAHAIEADLIVLPPHPPSLPPSFTAGSLAHSPVTW
jgi:hypothetical protein